jgi:exportin-1
LQIGAQVAALTVGPEHNANFGNLYTFFMAQLVAILPPGTDLPAAYAGGSDEEQAFVQNLALFLTSYFRVRKCVRLSTSP